MSDLTAREHGELQDQIKQLRNGIHYRGSVSREAIFELERSILSCPQVEIPTEHDFADGLYARTVHLRAGTVLTGAIHSHESFFLVRTGQLLFTTETGVIHAGPGFLRRSTVGSKRAGYAITDCEVTEIMANYDNETDPDKLWDRFTLEPETVLLEGD